MRLADALLGVTRLALDTVSFIYYVEARSPHGAVVDAVLRSVDHGSIAGITSVVTLTEVLVHPFANSDSGLAARYRDLLLNSRNFQTVAVDETIAERAAELRARHKLLTPDALQIAVALDAGCEAFLTNDLA